MTQKQLLRRQFKERLSLGDGTPEMAHTATTLLVCSMAFCDAHSVMLYMAEGGEVDAAPAIEAAFEQGKRVCLPRCEKSGLMHAREITRDTALERSRYGILEPPADATVVAPDELSLIIVPALAYDNAGYRLGRGGGYYDRYLKNVQTLKAGLCYSFQLIPALPHEKHDVRVDMLFTDAGACVPGGLQIDENDAVYNTRAGRNGAGHSGDAGHIHAHRHIG